MVGSIRISKRKGASSFDLKIENNNIKQGAEQKKIERAKERLEKRCQNPVIVIDWLEARNL